MRTMMMCIMASINQSSSSSSSSSLPCHHPYHQQALSLQHSHWSGGDHRAPTGVHIMVGLFITTVGVVAAVGNVLVVITYVRYKDLRTRSNILIINLALGDLLMCVIDFPLLAIASFLQGWPFGAVVCRLYAFLTAVAGLVTINTLGVISADRYWAVVRRASPRQQLPKYVTGVIVLGVWVYAIGWAICPILGWGDYVLDGIGTTCTFDYLTRSWANRSFVISMVFGNFILPFVVMLFSYTQIWIAVCNVKRGLQVHQGRVAVGQHMKHSNRRQSVTSDVKADYPSVRSGRTLYKLSSTDSQEKTYEIPSKSKTFMKKESFSYKKSIFEKKEQDVDKKISITVNPIKPQLKDFIVFNFRKHTVRKDGSDSKPIGPMINVRKNGFSEDSHPRHQRYSFLSIDTTTTTSDATHNPENGQTKHQYYLVRGPQSPNSKVDSNCNKTFSESDRVSSKVSFSSYQKVISDKLFLKQHRYRLHCEYKTMKIIMYLLLAFIITWFPYVVVSMMGLFGDASRITYLTSVFPSLIAKSSIVFNPILYSISHPKVRKRILHLFLCYTRRNHHNNNNGVDGGTSGGPRHCNGHFSSSCSYTR